MYIAPKSVNKPKRGLQNMFIINYLHDIFFIHLFFLCQISHLIQDGLVSEALSLMDVSISKIATRHACQFSSIYLFQDVSFGQHHKQ